MYKVFGIVLALCLFQDTIAYCCFRNAYTSPCGCSDIETNGVFYSPCTSDPCVASCCFRDVSNVCAVCDNPSPVCSCLKSLESCGGCGECGGKVGCGRELIYFPEVEYPVVAVEMKPCCSCLKSVESSCGGCGECGKKVGCGCGRELIYFPEVEYPVFAVEMKPFYYGSCFCV